jgi:hypothetical protein
MQVSELRRVQLFFRAHPNAHPTEHFMHESQVEACIKAALELHFWPGINPYNKKKTSELWRIEVGKLMEPSIYWHTTPGLRLDIRVKGAAVSRWSDTRAWSNPDLVKEEAERDALDD